MIQSYATTTLSVIFEKRRSARFFICILMFCLAFDTAKAQTAAQYNFAATGGIYTPLSSQPAPVTAITQVTVPTADDNFFNGITIPFSFFFAGNSYTQVNVSTNGWMSLGNATTPNNITNSSLGNTFTSGTASYPLLAPLWDDISVVNLTGDISYATQGTSPNRVFIIQYSSMKWNYSSPADVISFQVKLYEQPSPASSDYGKIQFVYQQGVNNINNASGGASIGIASANGVYLSLNNSSTSPVASSSTNTTNIALKPANGQTYTFTPPAPCSGTPSPGNTNASVTNICVNQGASTNLSLQTGFTGVTYQWQSSSNGTVWTNIAGATASAYTATGINATTYFRCVVTCTSSGLSGNSNPVMVTYDPTCIYMGNGSVNACSGTFYDQGGNGNYANNLFQTFTIFPSTPGSAVRVTFNSFSTESGWDGLLIYNGPNTASPLIPSGLPAGAAAPANSFYGTNSPGVITSTAPDGSLTFVFNSDPSVVAAGWNATISCVSPCSGAPAPGITNATSTAVCTGENVTLSLSNTNMGPGITYQWQSSLDGTTFFDIAGANAATLTQAVSGVIYYRCFVTCTLSGLSTNSSTVQITGAACPTPVIMPSNSSANVTTCLTRFYDTGGQGANYNSNESDTITFYPATPGSFIRISFASFNTENRYDGLRIYNGTSTTSPLIPSGLPAGFNPATCPANSYYGTTSPGVVTSTSADGALTLVFTSDNIITSSGWDALVTCYTPPPCSGIPAPGNTVASSTSLCVGATTALTLQYATPGTGVTYQWEKSSALAGPYTPIAGATNNFLNTTVSANTYFRCKVICGGSQIAYSTPIQILYDNSCINMPNSGSIATCDAGFYDSGGIGANYGDRENRTFTIYPSITGNFVRVSFSAFAMEAGYDSLRIYDGNSVAAPLIGTYTGTTSPGIITSTASDGSLTFVFDSDESLTYAGWSAIVSCQAPLTCTAANTVAGNTVANPSVICSGENTSLSLSNTTLPTDLTYQWFSSANNVTYTPITGAVSASYSPAVNSSTWYQCVITCPAGFTSTSTPIRVVVNATPSIENATGATRCGVGTVNLTASGAGGVINWYTASNGGNYVGSGATFTTPSISATTSFFAAAFSVGVSESVGKVSPTATSTDNATNYGLVFDANRYFILDSARIYPNGTGAVTIVLQNAVGVPIATTTSINVTGNGSTAVPVYLGFSVPVGTGYKLLVTASTVPLVRDVSGNAFPYTSASGAIRLTGSWLGSASVTSSYYYLYNLKLRTGCESNRIEAVATVTTPPAITVSTPAAICPGNSSTITVSSPNTNYTYSWAPGGATGTSVSVSPATTTTYTVTATDGTTGCANNGTATVTVNPLPSALTVIPSTATICGMPTVTNLITSGGTMPDGSQAAVTWTPITDLWRDAAATLAYAGSNTTSIYLKPMTAGSFVYTATATSPNGCTVTATSTLTVNINNTTVSIAQSPSGTQCTGTPITFTATPNSNIGSLNIYQWYINNVLQTNPTPGPTFTTSSLVNGDQVKCILLTNLLTCNAFSSANGGATSNIISMSLTPSTPTSVTLSTATTTVCQNTPISFTTTNVNGGASPTYEFFVGNTSVQAASTTSSLTYSFPTVGTFRVKVKMISNATNCPNPSTAWDSATIMTVNPSYPVSVSITAPGASANSINVCAGSNVTFTATPTNGGTTPAYQWKVNGSNVGTNSPTYTSTFNAGDIVTCVLTSSYSSCAPNNPATSNAITVSISSQAATVQISSVPAQGFICAGASATYTATALIDGVAISNTLATFQFFVNGNPVGNVGNTYTYTPSDGDVISVNMTPSPANYSCAAPIPATAATVPQVLAIRPTATITPSNNTCDLTSITLDAGSTAGNNYQWQTGSSITGPWSNVASNGTSSTYFTTTAGFYTVVVTNPVNSCSFTAPGYQVTLPRASTPMSGVYTIGAVTATANAAASGTTISVGSTANLTLGALVSVLSGTGVFAPNTIITSIGATSFTVNTAPTTAIAIGDVIAGATCTNYTSFRTAFGDLNSRGISATCTFNVSAGHTETLRNRTATANAASSGATINVASTANMYVGAVPFVSTGAGVFAPGTYITAINSATQFTVSTAPSTALGNTDVITLNRLDLGSSVLNPSIGANKAIVFQKSGAGANPVILSYSGGVGLSTGSGNTIPDGMIGLLGVDSVTFDGINLTDTTNATSGTNMEYGFGLFRLSNSDGAQRNTIKNCRIAMNSNNNQAFGTNVPGGSVGILSMTTTPFAPNTVLNTLTSAAEANSYNKFYSNNITKCSYGIALIGYGAVAGTAPVNADVFNDIGGATTATGNSITNYGLNGATVAAAAIYAQSQWSLNISNNTIVSASHTHNLRGIYGVSGAGANVSINNNNITLTSNSTGGVHQVFGIDNSIGATASSNTVNINNNTVTGTFLNATTGTFFAIQNSAACTNLNMNGNSVLNTTYGNTTTTPSQEWRGVYNSAAGCLNVVMNNNTISGNTINSTLVGSATASVCNALGTANANATGTPTVTMTGNVITSNVRNAPITAATFSSMLFVSGSTNGTVNVSNNTITDNVVNVAAGTTAVGFTLNSIYVGADSVSNISSNLIRNNGININVGTQTGAMVNYGINTSTNVAVENIFNNTIRRLYISSTSSPATASPANQQIYAINSNATITSTAGKGLKYYYGNQIDTIFTNAAYNGTIVGIRNFIGGTNINIYKNKITSLWPGQSATLNVSKASGITISTTATTTPVSSIQTNINNNMIVLSNTNAINSTADALRGIELTAVTANMTYKVFHNTIRITGSSAGANYSTSALFHTNNATVGNGTLDLRNNILVNESTPSGTGIVAAIRRSAAGFANDSTSCNNNILWAGTPQASPRFLYNDGTNTVVALPFASGTFGTREQNSKSFLPAFVSATDLHINPCDASSTDANYQGTTPIATTTGITDDIDNETRVTPKIGADEFNTSSLGGTVNSSTSVCSGTNSGTLTLSGYSGTIVRWESSTDSSTWTPIANTTTTQPYSNLTVKTWYRAVVNGTCASGITSVPAAITVNALPQISTTAAAGPYVTTASVCVGSSIQLYGTASAAFANPWVSGTPANATINTTTGIAVGVAAGTSTITYTNTNGCQSTLTLTVTSLPTISGTLTICKNGTTTLTGSGTPAAVNPWISATTSVATITSGGVVTGVSATNATTAATSVITYTNSGGCQAQATVTINPRPSITGTNTLCSGSSATLSGTPTANATSPWVSSNTSALTVNISGNITAPANATGSSIITYTNSFGCDTTRTITISTAPVVSLTNGGAGINADTICVGATRQLYGNGTGAATPWVSGNTSILTVTSGGLVTGVTAGNSSVTYTNNSGCSKTVLYTINPLPTAYAVTGTGSYCSGGTGVAIGLANSQSGVNYQLIRTGTPNVNVGTPVAGTGLAISFGLQTTGGTYIVSATNATTGCVAQMTGNAVVTINPLPVVTGNLAVCLGVNPQLSSATAANATNPWISSNTATATISNTGLVTSLAIGTTTITYTDVNGCTKDTLLTVSAASAGGTLSSNASECSGNNTGTLTVAGQTGNVVRWELSTDGGTTWSPVTNTTTSLTYTNLTTTTKYRVVVQNGGCSIAYSTVVTITVNPAPTVYTLSGGGSYCVGSSGVSIALSGSQTGVDYYLYLGATNLGYVTGTGAAISIPNITATGTYTVVAQSLSTLCTSNMTGSVTVSTYPVTTAAITQTGPINICSPATQTLNATTNAGSATYEWYVDGALITGASASSYVINTPGTGVYAVVATNTANNCKSQKSTGVIVNINTAPASVTIDPPTASFCAGNSVSLTASSSALTGNAIALYEDFNGTSSFTVSSAATSPAVSNWTSTTAPYNNTTGVARFSNFTTPNGGKFALTDADAGGNGSVTNTRLISPTFSLANYSAASLTFEHALFSDYLYDDTVQVDISTDGGTTWNLLYDYWDLTAGVTTNNQQTAVNATLPLTSYLGQSNVKIRFNYKSFWGYYWIIDNVRVAGVKTFPATYAWTPTTGLNVTTGTDVVATPPSTITYTATATANGCSNTGTATITVEAAPVIVNQPVAPAAICSGDGVITLSVGANGSGLTYNWRKGGVALVNNAVISGQGTSDLTLTNPTATDAGSYDVVVTNICNATVTSTTVNINITTAGSWIGLSTNWSDPTNWCGGVPSVASNVIIPAGRANYPVITSAGPVCNNITIATGGSVTVAANGKLAIAGTISNSGTFTAKDGTIEMSGASAQTIPANTFQNSNLRNLIINNASVTLAGKLNLLGKLSFSGSNRNFNIGDSLLFMKSSDTLTAYVGDITKDVNNAAAVSGNQITGNAVVERYISSRRAWRLLSMPTAHNAQTIKQAWQEGAIDSLGNNLPGYGIQITSNRTSWQGDGFDGLSTAGASVKFWNPLLASGQGAYEGIASTKATTTPNISDGKFVTGRAYMTFIRGDRSVRLISQNPTTTILREKGGFVTNNFTVNTGSNAPSQFVSVGNPYASAVDFCKLSKTGVGSSYYLWDPKTGTYGVFATFITNGTNVTGCVNCGAGTSYENGNYFIQSGQGFFVNTTAAGASVTFVENSKVDGSSLTTRANSNPSSLRSTLYRVNNGNAVHFDEVLNMYGSDFSNTIDQNDATKLGNVGENLSIQQGTQTLAIESRSALQNNDTIFYRLGQLRLANYRFEFSPSQLQDNNLEAFLEDAYLNNRTPVSMTDTTRVDFVINSDAGSYAADRFRLVFKPLTPVPVTFVDVRADKQVGNKVKVSWRVADEINIGNYIVERAADGRNFVGIGNVTAAQLSSYSFEDVQPLRGANCYRIRAVGNDGSNKFSNIAKVSFDMQPVISIYPNPILEDRLAYLKLDGMPSGVYQVRILNVTGQTMMRKSITHAGLQANYRIAFDKIWSQGSYTIEITAPDQTKTILKVLL